MVLPMLELWNWGEKGLTDSGLERGGEPPLGLPRLFPPHVIQGKSQGVEADD